MTKNELEKDLVRNGYLKSPLLIEAFKKIDRKDFLPRSDAKHLLRGVPEDLQGEAYGNYPLPIGFGQTISQPLTVAFMLELLDPRPGEKILDVGAGSGWQTALLAYCISAKGKGAGTVVAVERIEELKEMAEENVKKYNFIEKGVVKMFLGDGSQGAPLVLRPPEGFDKIIAAAAATDIPSAWKEQLKVGGRIVSPVFQSIWVLDKISEPTSRQGRGSPGAAGWKKREYFGFSFVPLISDKE